MPAEILSPMLASLDDAPLDDAELVYEPKYDGIRAIAEIGGRPRGLNQGENLGLVHSLLRSKGSVWILTVLICARVGETNNSALKRYVSRRVIFLCCPGELFFTI